MSKRTTGYIIAAALVLITTSVFLLSSHFRETYSAYQGKLTENANSDKQGNDKEEANKAQNNPEQIRAKAKEVQANELGSIPILVYHNIGEEEGRWTRTPENFRKDLQELYDRDYVLISFNDYLKRNIDIPAGKSPAIITFDDSTAGQFRLLSNDKESVVDPNSAVGILLNFDKEHPGFGHVATFFINTEPFGQKQYWKKKLKMLDELGFEIGNHQGELNGVKYNHDGVVLSAWRDAYSPYYKDFDPKKVQRIPAFDDNGKSSVITWLERLKSKRYISDGNKDTLAISEGWQDGIAEKHGLELIIYKKDSKEPERTPKKEKQASEAKGIHVTFSYASSKDRRQKILDLVEREKLNTVQLDVKDESGRIGYLSEVKLAQEIGSGRKMVPMKEFLQELKDRNIYSVARIVIFRDPFLAQKKPQLRVRRQDGSSVLKGEWVSPYSKEVWDYNIDLAKEAYELGFDEVQFDYIRFPENARDAIYSGKDDRHRVAVITDFLKYAREKLGWDRLLSATVFGFTGFAVDDMGIGQRPEHFAPYIDYISPMVYPSHYGRGNYGFDNPNAHPYEVINKSMQDFHRLVDASGCQIRPWLQSFSLGRPPYGRDEVKAQIQATEENEINTWLLWSPSVKYPDNIR